jgi:type II secretory pathway pseudopilin PulG
MIRTRNHRIRSQSALRRGFTLVELMVAAALAITIMWILAESFKMGIDFARSARSTGDMMTQLNNAGQIMLRDLQAPHFLTGTAGNLNGQLSLVQSDQLTSPAGGSYTPPNGYFQIVSPPPTATILDAGEGFQITTTAAPPGGNNPGASLAFTVFLPQGMPQNEFVTTAPAGAGGITYYSRAAEVAYFLEAQVAPAPTQTSAVDVTPTILAEQPWLAANAANAGPQPLYSLYRRQRLVAVSTDYQPQLANAVNPANAAYDPNAADVISFTQLNYPPNKGGVQYVPNTLASFGTGYTIPPINAKAPPRFVQATRVPLAPIQANSPRHGDDILLSNVLSFEVLAIWTPSLGVTYPGKTPTAIQAPQPYSVSKTTQQNPTNIPAYPKYTAQVTPFNSNYPFDNFSHNPTFNRLHPYTFDTWFQAFRGFNVPTWNNFTNAPTNQDLIPMPIRVTALQITIRIYDPKTKQARQNTWRVAM